MNLKSFDNSFLSDKIKLIAGIDEAGRGPLAGPVVAAAVIFDNKVEFEGVNDSKKLSFEKRIKLAEEIKSKAACYAYGIVDHKKIDEINILQATLHAMKSAAEQLHPQPDLILIDGNKTFHSNVDARAVVKGDQKSFAIAAASILAKVLRDEIMLDEAKKYPQFSWETNKGYGTKQHIEAILNYGPSPLHRKSFLGKILDNKSETMLFND